MTHAFRWTTTSRNDACVVQLWDGRTITAPEPCGVVAWPRLCFPSWPLSNCGRSILGCGSIGTCKAAPQPGARYPTTSNHSCLGTCPKTCARNCGWECRRRYQTPVDPQPAPAIPPEAGRWLFLRRAREAVRAEHGFGGCLLTVPRPHRHHRHPHRHALSPCRACPVTVVTVVTVFCT